MGSRRLAPPMLTTILTQALVVFVLMFSPLNFPPERLPDWLRAVHAVLSIQAMGEVIRGTLASTSFALHGAHSCCSAPGASPGSRWLSSR
jgi:ABC-2 type transport system permease protein